MFSSTNSNDPQCSFRFKPRQATALASFSNKRSAVIKFCRDCLDLYHRLQNNDKKNWTRWLLSLYAMAVKK